MSDADKPLLHRLVYTIVASALGTIAAAIPLAAAGFLFVEIYEARERDHALQVQVDALRAENAALRLVVPQLVGELSAAIAETRPGEPSAAGEPELAEPARFEQLTEEQIRDRVRRAEEHIKGR